MDESQLKEAINDLKILGFLYVETPEEARQLAEAAPFRTRVVLSPENYYVEVVTDEP